MPHILVFMYFAFLAKRLFLRLRLLDDREGRKDYGNGVGESGGDLYRLPITLAIVVAQGSERCATDEGLV